MSCGCLNTMYKGAMGLSKVALRIGIADKGTIQKRRDHCRKCEYSTKNKDRLNTPTMGLTTRSICQKCHCLIVAKTQLKEEKCPIKLW